MPAHEGAVSGCCRGVMYSTKRNMLALARASTSQQPPVGIMKVVLRLESHRRIQWECWPKAAGHHRRDVVLVLSSRDPTGLSQSIFWLPSRHSRAGAQICLSALTKYMPRGRESRPLSAGLGGVAITGVVTGQSALWTVCSPAVAPVLSPASVFPDGNAPGVVAQPASTKISTHRVISSPIPRVCMTSLSYARVGVP